MDENRDEAPVLTVPYFRKEEIITSSRYRWKCYERGSIPYVILQWTLAGEGRIDCERGTLSIPVDYAFVAIVPELSTYYYPPENKEPWVFGWLNFYGEFACELFRKFRAEFGPVVALSQRGAAAASLRQLLSLASHYDASLRNQMSLQAYAFYLEWWEELAHPRRRGDDGLEWAIRFCRERFREPLLVKQIADEAGMSREYFSRRFVERTGQTPAAFLRRLRLEEASVLLRDTRLPLEEIAMRSGFCSATHLMHNFQRIYGKNPSQCRQPASVTLDPVKTTQ